MVAGNVVGWRRRALETGFTPEQLAELNAALSAPASSFDAFGITARYRGANAVIMLITVDLEASMKMGVATADGGVLVEGSVHEPMLLLRAMINQGELGFEECVADERVRLPRYAFMCQMALSDDEA